MSCDIKQFNLVNVITWLLLAIIITVVNGGIVFTTWMVLDYYGVELSPTLEYLIWFSIVGTLFSYIIIGAYGVIIALGKKLLKHY